MQIFVKNVEGETLTLTVEPTDRIEDLLDQLTQIDSSFEEDGHLVFGGLILDEEQLISELTLEEGSTVNFVVGLAGGAKKRKKKNYTTPKKNKHKKKKVKLAVLRYYKVDENGKINRLRRECTNDKCGAGVFMASHFDRQYCGKCGLTFVFDKPEQSK
ncbi:ubiquitin-40S ribosomal protein S27a-like [Panonychus citri]|uniref:ubiquitin-40S ribosomal protein S27a-like n=1 Tax=Panonychus citri TaxID=50023 RepID=UPI0023079FF8|nr:ubiquitin-40S ribosomal protein S27a-like [Panonychus citri]